MQELFRYDESWTGTEGSGGSGHSAAQEDAALVAEGYEFEGPCLLMVSVNESYAVVLEGQEEGELRHDLMGVYERMEDKLVNGRGVWQAVGGIGLFLGYSSTKKWVVSDRESMEAGNGKGGMAVVSTAATPDQIAGVWRVNDGTTCGNAPNLRVRVCSSVEKYAAEQRVVQHEEQAMVQAQLSRQLVVERLVNDRTQIMGVFELMEGKVVNGRAVWQKQGGAKKWFLYYSHGNSSNGWLVSKRDEMEAGSTNCIMRIITTALTPDQARPSDVWGIVAGGGNGLVDAPAVRVRRQT
jgi:hypothetical protein